MLLGLTIACAPESTDAPDDPLDTGSWTPAEHVLASPVWDVAEVEAEWTAMASEGLPALRSVRNAYADLMALGDETCPGDPTRFDDGTVPLTGCTAESGVSYAGIAAMFEDEELGGTATMGFIVFGDFQLTDTDGATLVGGGKAAESVYTSPDGVHLKTELSGTWIYPNGEGWLIEGASGAMFTEGVLGDHLALEMTGGLGLRDRNTYTSGLVFDESTCPAGHPSGEMAIRDPSGGWWTVTLPDDCTGCGELSWTDGAAHGTVCPELWRLGASWKVTAGSYQP